MDLKEFCTLFYASHYLPIALFTNGRQVASFCSLEKPIDVFYSALPHLLSAEQNPAIYTSATAGLYGAVKINGTTDRIIVGPVFSGVISDEVIYEFMRNNAISMEHKNEITVFLSALPKYTYNQFLNLLAFLHHSLNGETIDLLEHFRLADKSAEAKIAARHTLQSVQTKDIKDEHGTYQFEMLMIDYVRRGDTEKLNILFDDALKKQILHEGTLAENPLRQAKNLFIGLVTMVGKAGAIQGGMGVEEVYNLIDLYIQECEKAQSIELIKVLQYHMLFDFTERVARSQVPPNLSKDIFTCVQFIKNHTNDHIGINDVANHIGKSRAYVTQKFKKELGKTINDFIMECKLKDACSLLLHSDLSISEISDYLCFANQPYFQNKFRQIVGVTPAVFRRNTVQGVYRELKSES